MTITYTNKYEVQARVRRRRRKIAGMRMERINVRARRIFTVVCVCLVTGLIGYIGVHDGSSDTGLAYTAQAAEETHFVNVTVQKGDTLWSIADEYIETSEDIRKYIQEIRSLNGIESGNIYPGQLLRIPVPAHLI